MIRRPTHDERKKFVHSMTQDLAPLYEEGNLAELGRLTTEIITLHKNHIPALTYKGIYFKEKSQPKNALKYLEHAAELGPESKFTLVNLGKLYVYFRRFSKAEQTFNQALGVDPEDADVLKMRGNALISLERNQEALECFLEAIKLDSANLDYRIGKARAQRRIGDIIAAIDTIERILVVDPRNLGALKEKGIILANKGKYNEGMKCVEEALEVGPNDLEANLFQGKIYEIWDKYEDAFESYLNAELLDKGNVMIIAKKICMLHELEETQNMKEEFYKLETLFKNDCYQKMNKQGNMKYTERRQKFLKELVDKASNFMSETNKFDPKQNLFQYLQHHEYMDYFVFIISQLGLAADIDRFISEKRIRQNIKEIEDFLNSRFITFSMKQELEVIDESPFIESYKRTMVRLFRVFVRSFEAARKNEFSKEKSISMIEFNLFPLLWHEKSFKRRTQEFFEWNNMKNYIQNLVDKYDDFFSNRFWEDMLNFVRILKDDQKFRRRLKNYKKIARFKEFNSRKMKSTLLDILPSHIVSTCNTDAELAAFVDFEEMKQILSRSYFPKPHLNRLKFDNMVFLLLHPEIYKEIHGSILLRSTDEIYIDEQEFMEMFLNESLKIISISYEAKQIYTPNSLKDHVEVIVDSFFVSGFGLTYEGHMVEKKTDFLIPSEDYVLMINLRISTKKGNLHRKVKVNVNDLKRGCMNFVDIFEEGKMGMSVSHMEKSGRLGLYIL
jgi:tetratricopeptide (TPR) repeat protein